MIPSLMRLLSFLYPKPEIIRARPMTDGQLLEALSVDADHPIFQAFLELIDRSRTESRTTAKAVIRNDRETLFALGAEQGFDQLESYLMNLRSEAMRIRSTQTQ